MNSKILAAAALIIAGLSMFVIVSDLEDSEATPDNSVVTITFESSPSTAASLNSIQLLAPYTVTISGDVLYINDSEMLYTRYAPSVEGYSFDGWTAIEGSGQTEDQTITMNYVIAYYYVYIVAGPGGYIIGDDSFIGDDTFYVPHGTQITTSGNTIQVGSYSATASANINYTFDAWTQIPSPATVTDSITIKATFSYDSPPQSVSFYANPAYLTAGNYGTLTVNGSEVYTFDEISVTLGSTVTMSVTMTNPAYDFDYWEINNGAGSSTRDYSSTLEINDFTLSGYIFTPVIKMKTYTVTIQPNDSDYGSVSQSTILGVNYGTQPTVNSAGNVLTVGTTTVTATPIQGYKVGSWSNVTNPITANTTITANFVPGVDTAVTLNVGAHGSISPNNVLSVEYGQTQRYTITADEGYVIEELYWNNVLLLEAGGQSTYTTGITGNGYSQSITVTFRGWDFDDLVYWENGHQNGRIDMLFNFSEASNNTHIMNFDVNRPTTVNGTTTWTTMYGLQIRLSYPMTEIQASIEGVGVNQSATLSPGNWPIFVLSVDTNAGKITMTPVKKFTSFSSYTLYDDKSSLVMDFSENVTGAAMSHIRHSEEGSAANNVRFSVVNTSVFLDTYGVVMNNPSINVYDYFPEYQSVRLNFYSFALYGDSISINGVQYPVSGAKITVQYVKSGKENLIPSLDPDKEIQVRTFELSNIYATWDALTGHCYLTFVNDRFTLDLGSYTAGQENVAFTGLWYFTTMLYEPTIGYEKSISDWKPLPTLTEAQTVLIFLGILAVAAVAVAIHIRKSGLGYIDLAIVIGAGLIGFLLLG